MLKLTHNLLIDTPFSFACVLWQPLWMFNLVRWASELQHGHQVISLIVNH